MTDPSSCPSLEQNEVFLRLKAEGLIKDLPYVDPDYLDKLAVTMPLVAVHECMNGLTLLHAGTHVILWRYIAATYSIAHHIKQDQHLIERFAADLALHGFMKKKDVGKTTAQLLEQTFYFTFCHSGVKRNRIYQYAYALQECFRANMPPNDVKTLIFKSGIEDLYRKAGIRNKLIKAQKLYEDTGRNIHQPIDETYLNELPTLNSAAETMLNATGLIERIVKGIPSENEMDGSAGIMADISPQGFKDPAYKEPLARQIPDVEDNEEIELTDYELLFDMVQKLTSELKHTNSRVKSLEKEARTLRGLLNK